MVGRLNLCSASYGGEGPWAHIGKKEGDRPVVFLPSLNARSRQATSSRSQLRQCADADAGMLRARPPAPTAPARALRSVEREMDSCAGHMFRPDDQRLPLQRLINSGVSKPSAGAGELLWLLRPGSLRLCAHASMDRAQHPPHVLECQYHTTVAFYTYYTHASPTYTASTSRRLIILRSTVSMQ
jgi:hypothetical protein